MKPTPGATPTPGTPPEGAPPPVEQKWKLKIDGKVEEMTMAEVEKWAQKGRFSDKATQEARELIKRTQAAQRELEAREAAAREKAKTDTDTFLKELGIDPDEYARRKLERKVEEGKMTPEQRRVLEQEAEIKRLKEAQELREKEIQAEQQKQVVAQLQKRIENELVSAAKRAGMSTGDETFYAIYESFKEMHELGLLPTDGPGLQPHHADLIVEDARERLNQAQKSLRENALKLKGDALLDFVGKEAVDAIVAARVEQIRAARGIQAPKPTEQPRPAAPRPNGYLTPAEAEAQLKNLQRRA